ncbi:MAG: hypothetical protein O7F76_03895 [Planctomycetota bacterium]|nr:hypothetical protein [Planctomycetota bacterium]MCZ6699138.1 hypothetical protein [Planctomycetota bacterium]MCZ6815825.1 hypothetical protein [Planctomycetota bacterium]
MAKRWFFCARSGVVHRFNAATLVVWDACDGARDLDSIDYALSDNFGIDRVEGAGLAKKVIFSLSERGLLSEAEEDSETPEAAVRPDIDPDRRRGLTRRKVVRGGVMNLVLAAPLIDDSADPGGTLCRRGLDKRRTRDGTRRTLVVRFARNGNSQPNLRNRARRCFAVCCRWFNGRAHPALGPIALYPGLETGTQLVSLSSVIILSISRPTFRMERCCQAEAVGVPLLLQLAAERPVPSDAVLDPLLLVRRHRPIHRTHPVPRATERPSAQQCL